MSFWSAAPASSCAAPHLDGLPDEVVDAAAGVQEVDVHRAGLADAVRTVCTGRPGVERGA